MTVYYIHQDLCQEIKTLTVTTEENINAIVTTNNVQQHQTRVNIASLDKAFNKLTKEDATKLLQEIEKFLQDTSFQS